MEEKQLQKVIAFDTLFTTNRIQMMKILLTYMAPSTRKTLAVYIKFMELQYTLSFFEQHPDATILGLSQEKEFDVTTLCNEILPLCNADEKQRVSQICSMMEQFKQMQDMMQMVQMMQEMSPDGNPFSSMSGEGDGSFDFLSGLAGMDISQFKDFFNNN